jgi:hypothetical protein
MQTERGDGERAFLTDSEGLVALQVSSARLRGQHPVFLIANPRLEPHLSVRKQTTETFLIAKNHVFFFGAFSPRTRVIPSERSDEGPAVGRFGFFARLVDARGATHEALAAARQRDGSGPGGVYGFSDGQNSAETGRHDPARRFRVGSFGDCVQAGDVLGLCNFRRGRMRTVLVGSRLERSDFSRARSLCAGLNGEAETCKRQ